MKFIIIDLKTKKAITNLEGKTIVLSSEIAADELAKQICKLYLIAEINL